MALIRAGNSKQRHYVTLSEGLPCAIHGSPKMAQFLYALTLPNINRFSKLFHCQIQWKIYNNDFTTPQLCCYTCVKSNNKNKTTSVTTHLKKLTTGNNVFMVSVIVQSNGHILQLLHKMFNVSALLLDDALLKCIFTEVVMFSIVAFKTLDISQGSVATQLRCGGIFSDSIITNVLLILRVK